MASGGLLSAPNLISFSRLVLAAAFVRVDASARVVVVALAGLSDYLDGWLARRHNTATRLGALVDAVTDRVFVLTAVTTFVTEGALSLSQALVLISRDLATTTAFFLARSIPRLRGVTFKARMPGKVTTVLQMAVLLSVLVAPPLTNALVMATGVVSAVAIADYTVALWRARASV